MEIIKLVGAEDNRGYRYFALTFCFMERWVVLHEGWEKEDGPVQVLVNVLDPEYDGDPVVFDGKEIVHVYTDRGEYLVECSLRDGELLGGFPCPPWAVACELLT